MSETWQLCIDTVGGPFDRLTKLLLDLMVNKSCLYGHVQSNLLTLTAPKYIKRKNAENKIYVFKSIKLCFLYAIQYENSNITGQTVKIPI